MDSAQSYPTSLLPDDARSSRFIYYISRNCTRLIGHIEDIMTKVVGNLSIRQGRSSSRTILETFGDTSFEPHVKTLVVNSPSPQCHVRRSPAPSGTNTSSATTSQPCSTLLLTLFSPHSTILPSVRRHLIMLSSNGCQRFLARVACRSQDGTFYSTLRV